jgi:NDP-sugar pyrophosphorylase family protein
MRAMILAAGKGTRLRPLTDTVPKPLVDVAGRPMIAYPLDLLRRAGIQEVVINLHHLGEQIRTTLGDGHAYGIRIIYSEEPSILDTGGAIAAARDYLSGDTFVVLNADTFIDVPLQDVIEFHHRRQAVATMVVRADPDAVRKDDIRIDTLRRLRRMLAHAHPADASAAASLPRFFYAGVQVFDPRVFAYLPPGVYSITRDVYPRLLAADEPLYGYVHQGYWRVLDTPSDLAAGRREIAARLRARDECS